MFFDISFVLILIFTFIFLIMSIFVNDKSSRNILIIVSCGYITVLSLLFFLLYNRKNPKVHKPTDLEWENLIKKTSYHLTFEKYLKKIEKYNGNVYLKTTKSLAANIPMFFRPSIYFFIDKPNIKQLKKNEIDENRNYTVCVEIKDLDRKKVRIRKSDNVLVYIGSYNGKGKIIDYKYSK